MQYVAKRFQPLTASDSDADDNNKYYTAEEIAQGDSQEPTTTTALASLIASIPIPTPVTT